MKGGLSRFYFYSVLVLMLIAPAASIAIEAEVAGGSAPDWWALGGKWFVFWASGVRLFLAGIRQTVQPGFTAQTIFGIEGSDSHAVVRELGMANISMGALGLASLCLPQWRVAAAAVSGLYYGLAAVGHIARKPDGANERVALVSDLWITAILAAFVVHVALAAG
jgi:hypothetical protein